MRNASIALRAGLVLALLSPVWATATPPCDGRCAPDDSPAMDEAAAVALGLSWRIVYRLIEPMPGRPWQVIDRSEYNDSDDVPANVPFSITDACGTPIPLHGAGSYVGPLPVHALFAYPPVQVRPWSLCDLQPRSRDNPGPNLLE